MRRAFTFKLTNCEDFVIDAGHCPKKNLKIENNNKNDVADHGNFI